MDTPLDAELRAALEKRKGDWKQIAADADISYSWLSQFARDKIPNPGYGTLQKLAAALALHAELIDADHPAPAEPSEAAHG